MKMINDYHRSRVHHVRQRRDDSILHHAFQFLASAVSFREVRHELLNGIADLADRNRFPLVTVDLCDTSLSNVELAVAADMNRALVTTLRGAKDEHISSDEYITPMFTDRFLDR